MAASDVTTMLANLVDPEVLADFIDKKLTDYIRLSPLAKIDTTLVGRPGDEITLPSYSYIGDATFVGEGQDIPIARLSASTAKVKVAKIGKAVEITDEAIISGAGDITAEAGSQILTAMNSGVENQLLQNMRLNATLLLQVVIRQMKSQMHLHCLVKILMVRRLLLSHRLSMQDCVNLILGFLTLKWAHRLLFVVQSVWFMDARLSHLTDLTHMTSM